MSAAQLPDSSDLEGARARMMRQLAANVRDPRVLDAMASVPREAFVLAHLRAHAYDDRALPIGEGQTISQPLIVALMLEAMRLTGDEHVLEVGTGSGYVAALLSRLAHDVVTVERKAELLEAAKRAFAGLGIENVGAYEAGDTLGWPERAPYDAILVSAASPHVPRALIDQLAPGGRLVIPVGGLRSQELVRATNTSHGVELERLGPCVFVPLIGDEAWRAATPDERENM
jgi:protein-L-isoaspartate(D-aspartate) O-methyltransferase